MNLTPREKDKLLVSMAAEVARQGVEGLDKGRLVVIPGVANRVSAVLGQVAPRTLMLPILVKQHPRLR